MKEKTKNHRPGGINSKILIATGIYPPDIGGPARMVGELAKELKKNGFEVRIITYSSNSKKEDGVLRIKKGFLGNLKYFLAMFKLVLWADLVYATDLYSVGYFSYIYKKILGRKYIIRFAGDSAWEVAINNGWINEDTTNFEEKKFNKKIEKLKDRRRKVMVNADRVIAVSEFMNKLAVKIGAHRDRVKTIYNSVDFLKEEKSTLKKNLKKIFVTSGRLVKLKGIDILIEVFAKLKDEIDFELLIVGDGPEEENLKNLVKKRSLDNRIVFAGRVAQDEVLSYYAKADFFILNSFHESFSHILLEALSLGMPVITARAGGNPEIIDEGENGILVNFGEKGELEEAIKEMNNNKKWSSIERRQVCKNSIKRFNWEENIKKTIILINSL